MQSYNNREDVPLKYRWDLSTYFKDTDEFKESMEQVKEEIKKIEKYVGCTKDANLLKEYIEFDINLVAKIMDLEIYAFTLADSDLEKSEPVELIGYASNLYKDYQLSSTFFEEELLELSNLEYNKLLQNKELIKYQPYLDNLYRYKEHHLNQSEQKIVSSLSQTLDNYGNMASTLINSNHDYGKVLIDGKEEVLTSTNYRMIMKSLPREKREEVYKQFFKVRDQYATTSASILNDYVLLQNNRSLIYKFSSSWENKLFSQQLNNKVFSSLINACLKRRDVIKKYYDLKSHVLNISECMPWDAPLELYEGTKEYSIEESQNLCLEALKPLGDDYLERFKLLIQNRAVDYCEYKGKRSGGYNVSSIDKKISHILMSFNGDLSSVSTLAHEGGHFTHHTYLFDNNDIMYRDHEPIICEVASLTNECLLSNYLLENGTKEEGLAGLSNIISVIMSNLFGAVCEGDMEREFYGYSLSSGTLTKDYMYKLTEETIKKFYPIDKLQHEYQKCGWIGRSHYFMFFYLFSYAICISVACYLSLEIKNGNKDMIDKYKKFLATGSNVSVKDTFKIIDVDLEDEKVYLKAIDYFEKLLDQFAKLYEEV